MRYSYRHVKAQSITIGIARNQVATHTSVLVHTEALIRDRRGRIHTNHRHCKLRRIATAIAVTDRIRHRIRTHKVRVRRVRHRAIAIEHNRAAAGTCLCDG